MKRKPTPSVVVALIVLAYQFALPISHRLSSAADGDAFATLAKQYDETTRPALKQFCLDCHSTAKAEGELDLERFTSIAQIRRDVKVWQKVIEMLDNEEMPPKDSKQPTAAQRKQLRSWAESFLNAEARANAGDPGPVVLRRLNNAEYTHTIRDLTGVSTLNPAKEFPVDGAAGEGFTNVGNALVMSPALITKYLDSAKDIAAHAVLLPNRIRFAQSTTSADWTNESLANIRDFYAQFSDASGGTKVNLQGIVFDTNSGGRLPVEKYIAVTIAEREALQAGRKKLADVAREHALNPKYLGILWDMLNKSEPSLLVDSVRAKWKVAKPEDANNVNAEIHRWQQSLWRFTSVGHIGKQNGPKSWQEPVVPMTQRQELRVKIVPTPGQKDVTLYLLTSDAGDGNENDFAMWERPRIVAPGRPEFLLRDIRDFTREILARREQVVSSAAKTLDAAAEAAAGNTTSTIADLAKKYDIAEDILASWLDFLGIGANTAVKLDYLAEKQTSGAGYDFVKGWTSDKADKLPSLVANSSDQHVRIPGNMKPHGVCVHPTPTVAAVVSWMSQAAGVVRIDGKVTHAHPECGNGVTWTVELRRGTTRLRLANGVAHGGQGVAFGPVDSLAIQKGDYISLAIGPRDGNHSCDLTDLELNITSTDKEGKRWSLTEDNSPNILAGNPHADRHGNEGVWHFHTEPVQAGDSGTVIPTGSLLARWQATADRTERAKLAASMQALLIEGPKQPIDEKNPDLALYRQITSLGGPIMRGLKRQSVAPGAGPSNDSQNEYGVDPRLFGKHPNGSAIEAASMCVRAPAVVEVRLPADLAADAEFVATTSLHVETGKEGSVQFQVTTTKPESQKGLVANAAVETNANGPWTSNNKGVSHTAPIVANSGTKTWSRIEGAMNDFRSVFPIALCYTKIVPVDEVVTLTLFYREDEYLQRLMLDDAQTARLNQLWSDMHYTSRDALTLVDAYNQLMEFATQDADPKVFEPLRKPINDRAEEFKELLSQTEPKHVDHVLAFAEAAYRRPLKQEERQEIKALYANLRKQELPHDEAIRLLIARVLVAPAFLYKAEKPSTSNKAAPIDDWELANRLSYFFWSSMPDQELRSLAASNRLHERDVILSQVHRMLRDPKSQRMGAEFALQWLHIYDFEHLDEKSERHFPTFAPLRGPMQEESVRYFTNLIQQNESVLDLVKSDYTFLNEELAKHYGIPDVVGPEWRRVNGVGRFSRGGILTQASTLSKQSGASRTSPILRGNWLSETLLGEKLPRPPKNVPQLPDSVPQGLTERQLIEKHSSDPLCIKCHMRVDPFGYALEGYDAIGRVRAKDTAGLTIDSKAQLPDGTSVDGVNGLRDYFLTKRRDDFVKQFCRKLLGYSLGRAVQLSDEPLLEEMRKQLSDHDYRIWAAIDTIVLSEPFRNVRPNEVE